MLCMFYLYCHYFNVLFRFVHLSNILVTWGVSQTFRELAKIFSLSLCIAEVVLLMRISRWNLWEFQGETLYVCPKPCFGHTYKVSPWNSHHKYDFWHCVFSREKLESAWNLRETRPVYIYIYTIILMCGRVYAVMSHYNRPFYPWYCLKHDIEIYEVNKILNFNLHPNSSASAWLPRNLECSQENVG